MHSFKQLTNQITLLDIVSPEQIQFNFSHDPRSSALTITSRLKDLSLDFAQIDWSCKTWDIAQNFDKNPLRSGIVLVDGQQFKGMISRRRFLQRMSRPYSLELFAQRPISFLYPFVQADTLFLQSHISIVEATQIALERRPESVYEPIVVQDESGQYGILDTHHLLIAHAHIHILTTKLLQQSSQQLEAVNLELKRLASLDGLTEIANRRHFNDYLLQIWEQLRQSQAPLSLILIDVDHFKIYNDTYGHLAGDDCLRKIAKTLQTIERNSYNLVARYGGEEFAIILPNCPNFKAQEITQILQHRIAELNIPHLHSTVSDYVTLSMGIATCIPHWDNNPQDLIQASDRALYQAKQQGRDRAVFHAEYPFSTPYQSDLS